MTVDDPLLRSEPAMGCRADRLAALWAGLGLALSAAAALWFFAGFFETDPQFPAASSALLLSLLLGAFALIPCGLALRLCWSAWRGGFRTGYGFWVLTLFLPWTALGILILRSDWLPAWLGMGGLIVSLPLLGWAIASLWLERRSAPRR